MCQLFEWADISFGGDFVLMVCAVHNLRNTLVLLLLNMYITLYLSLYVHAWWLNSEIIRLRPKHLWALLCYIANETKYMHLIILTYTIINVHLSKLSLEEGFPDSWLPLLPGIFYITCPLYPDYRLFWCIWPFVYCSAAWEFAMIS